MKPVSNSDEPAWLQIARREIGQREKSGPMHNARILQYFRATSYHADADEIPWCAAYVNFCLEQAGVRGTKRANASSFATWGDSCDLKDGAVVVFGKHDPDAGGTGHVAFCVGVEARYVLVLGGNQNNAVNIARRERDRIVAVRWPAAQ